MATLIDKINQFESLPKQTVFHFNKIFVGNELSEGNLSDEVTIEDIAGPANVRFLTVGDKRIKHEFNITKNEEFSPIEESNEEPRLKPQAKKARFKFVQSNGTSYLTRKKLSDNETAENLVLEDREMQLDPIEYMVLQYLRGCVSVYHTQVGIASRLNKSDRGIRNVLNRMEEKNIIKVKSLPNHHRIEVKIAEEWR